MRSQSLFNFFTKVADVRTTSAGTRIHPEFVDESPTAARTSAAAQAEMDRRARMTQEQRWEEDFNNHVSDQAGAGKDQYNFAFDNYLRDLAAAVASGKMKEQDAAKARQYIIDSVRAKQREFHTSYLASYNTEDHTDADRKGIRGTRIRTTHGDNGLVHFRYGDFGENTTFGGAERGYKQRDARMAAGAGRGGAGATAGGAKGTPKRVNGFEQQWALENEYAKRKKDENNPATPLNFKGGYAVNFNPEYVKDWTRASDATGNWVNGTWYTGEQYLAYKDIYGQLFNSMTGSGGMNQAQAKAEASRLAKMYMDDQMLSASNRTNKWMEPQQPATQPETPPTTAVKQVAPPTITADTAQSKAKVVTPAQPAAKPVTQPDTIDALASYGNKTQPEGQSAGESGAGAGAGVTPEVSNPGTPSLVVGHDVDASNKYIGMLKDNRKSTLDSKKYKAVEGYNGIYTKVGDRSGALYDRFGKQFTYQGKPVDDALLTTDEDWWLPGYGNNIRANISAHEDNRFRDNIFRPDELAAIGFTEEVAGHKGHWRNPATGEIIDGNGKVYGGGTALHDVPIHRPNSARHSNYHGMAWWYDGSRHDVGVQR